MIALTGILLAAGRGSRFDPSGARNKLLQPFAATLRMPGTDPRSATDALAEACGADGGATPVGLLPIPQGLSPGLRSDSSVVAACAQNLLAVLPRVVAVVRPGGEAVAAELRALGCETIICELADTGMAASLMHAIGHTRDADGWIVALGDMPHVSPSTIQSLKSALDEGAGIAAPVYRGQRGNPVGFGRQYLPQLLALEGDQGARGILKQFPVREVDVDDSGILQDIDTPEDLHRQGST